MASLRVSRPRRAGRVAALLALLASPFLLTQPTWAQSGSFPADRVKQEFPRLAGIQISGPSRSIYPGRHNDPDYLDDISKLDVAILHQLITADSARRIKAKNPNILLGLYTNITEVSTRWPGEHETWRRKLDNGRGPNSDIAPDWWLYDINGEKIETWPGTLNVNISDHVKPDANGDNWVSYRVKFDYQRWYIDPVWDVWYSDVVLAAPRHLGGNFGRFTGGSGTWSDEKAAWRRGHRQHWDNIYEIRPGTMVLVNFDWFRHWRGDLGIFEQQVNGGVYESAITATRLPKGVHRWEITYEEYRTALSFLAKPEVLLFHVKGGRQDWQFFRYTFATSLMADGFFKYSPSDEEGPLFGTVEWFDEFDRAGRDNTSWLGRATSGPPESAWQNGVYRRDFENGVALVNPHRNGAQTVRIEPGFRRIMGVQDSAVNNGQPAGEIRLLDGDGIILVREDRETKLADPEPPALRLGN